MTLLQLNAGELNDALRRCAMSVSNEETRYYLKGINVRPEKKAVVFESTDGHRMTQVRVPCEAVPQFPNRIITRETAQSIVKAHKNRWNHFGATIRLDDDPVAALPNVDNVPLAFIDGTFPDCERVVPREPEHSLTVLSELFLSTIESLHGFLKPTGHLAVKLTASPADKTLKLSCGHSIGLGSAELTIELSDTNLEAPFQIGFNSYYLLEFLKHVESKSVIMRTSDAGSPTLFAGDTEPHQTFVLMPMRV